MRNAPSPGPRSVRVAFPSYRWLTPATLALSLLALSAGEAAAQATVVTTPDPAPRDTTTVVTQPAPEPPRNTTVVTQQPTPPPASTTVVTPAPEPRASTTVVTPAPEPRAVVVQDDTDPPSVFDSGYQGLLAGTLVGGGAGYLAARDGGWERSDWRSVGLGLGIGALSGAALGISLGIADRSGAPGGRYVARDLSLGAVFGAAIGTIGGGIAALAQDDAERVLFGASIGVVAGAGLGIITGIIEGQSKRDRNLRVARAGLEMRPTLAVATPVEGSGRLGTVMPGVSGRF